MFVWFGLCLKHVFILILLPHPPHLWAAADLEKPCFPLDRQTDGETDSYPPSCTMLLASAPFSLPCAVWDEASEILLISACFSCNCLQVMLVLVFETCRSPLFFISIYFSNQLKVSFFCFVFLLLNIGTMCYSNHEMLFYSEIKLVTVWNALKHQVIQSIITNAWWKKCTCFLLSGSSPLSCFIGINRHAPYLHLPHLVTCLFYLSSF